ncbi:MAG TPA: sigma-70 family RNA polymerase sigma factor [Acidimicrobiia bacterium]|nr:sigma-70 family RNA polymerase sigma factor [Acidimicrobiia bacterium]
MLTTDERLVGLETFESFYRREFRRLVAFVLALSGSRSGAEDLAQEALMVAHAQWERVSVMDRPDAWVRRVASNMAVSQYRKRIAELKAVTRLAGQRQGVIEPLEPRDDEFWRAVRSLPRNQATAVALHYLEDRPVSDIAEVLDCSPSTAKVHLHRGRKALAEKLGGFS